MPVTRETTAARQFSGDRMRSATIGVVIGAQYARHVGEQLGEQVPRPCRLARRPRPAGHAASDGEGVGVIGAQYAHHVGEQLVSEATDQLDEGAAWEDIAARAWELVKAAGETDDT
jgi:hypothetical protein